MTVEVNDIGDIRDCFDDHHGWLLNTRSGLAPAFKRQSRRSRFPLPVSFKGMRLLNEIIIQTLPEAKKHPRLQCFGF